MNNSRGRGERFNPFLLPSLDPLLLLSQLVRGFEESLGDVEVLEVGETLSFFFFMPRKV